MESGYFLGSDPSFANIAFGNLSSNQFNPLLLLDHPSQGQNPLVTSLAQNPTPAIIHDRGLDSGRGPPPLTESNSYPAGASFSRPRGRRSNSRKNRNRGQNTNSFNKWYGGGGGGPTRRSSEGQSISSEESWNVEDLISVISNIPKTDSLGLEIYTAIRNFDSRLCSTLLKSLSKSGHSNRAMEIFDWLRESFNDLTDVFTYTAMISSCIHDRSVSKALEFVDEMHDRNIERNVHTYTALMNVCIKSGSCQLALDSFDRMKSDGIEPNVVTFNTLIDIYGKMGQWEQAIRVFLSMETEGIKPVLRTYNTLIISCNMCNQPREALAVYSRLLAEGFSPNATTYNALISAHGKAGQLDKVMDVFQEMIWKGCERTVITYSSLISACEKAGQWEVALQLFNEMQKEGCTPNTVTYNSLITACGQGAQWEKACEVFDQMRVQNCAPDVVTYTALITACERGGQWRRALQVYEQMLEQGCVPDAIVYNAIIDALWETGVIWAQRRAFEIFKQARNQGHFQQQQVGQNGASVEVNLHALTAGVAVLSLYDWLVDLRILMETSGLSGLPEKLFVVTDKGRNSKEQGNLIVKEAMAALLKSWESPFRPLQHSIFSGILKASGPELAPWILSPIFQSKLFCFFPCTNITPSIANNCPISEALMSNNTSNTGFLDDAGFVNEASVECRCYDAFAAVRRFESCHSLTVQAMGLNYLQHRAFLVRQILEFGKQLNQSLEVTHDAVLLMDRAMSTSIQIKENLLELLSVSCLVLSMKQSDPEQFPSEVQLEQVTDCRASAIAKMEFNLQQVLAGDSTAISTLRCVKLYLERLGTDYLDAESIEAISGETVTLVESSMTDLTFLNCRPSVIAAAILYAERRSRGVIPYWPSMLAKLTGYQDMSSPELTVAIKGAQKLCSQQSTGVNTGVLEGLSLTRTSSLDINAMVSMSVNDHSTALFQSCPVSGVGPMVNLENLLNLDSTGSLLSLPSLQGLEEDHQITADRIDGVVVTQGATVMPRVVQSLTQMTSGIPTLLPNGLIGSNLSMNPNLFGITLSGSPTKNESQEN